MRADDFSFLFLFLRQEIKGTGWFIGDIPNICVWIPFSALVLIIEKRFPIFGDSCISLCLHALF